MENSKVNNENTQSHGRKNKGKCATSRVDMRTSHSNLDLVSGERERNQIVDRD